MWNIVTCVLQFYKIGVIKLIALHRTPPIRLLKDKALLNRLPLNYPKRARVEIDYAKQLAGYQGEKALDYYLEFLPEADYMILQNLNLQNNYGKNFQIDFLLLSTGCHFTIDSKNLVGSLYFEEKFHQLIRSHNGKEEIFENPLIQGERHQYQFKQWLAKQKFPEIPIEYFVSVSQSSTKIEASPGYRAAQERICHHEMIPQKIIQAAKKHPQQIFSEKLLKKLIRQLIKSNVTPEIDICKIFDIEKSETIPGVQCPQCDALPMERVGHSWYCSKCHLISYDAHLQALYDFFLINGPYISSREGCEYLNLPSPRIARRIFQEMNINYEGSNKNRYYILTEELFQDLPQMFSKMTLTP